jgi:hypothetical protein
MDEELHRGAPGGTPSNFSPQKFVVPAAVVAILASALWIYYFEFRTSNANVPLHQSVGHALAEETSRVLGHHGNIVIVTMDARNSPELKIQLAAFEKELKTQGDIAIKDKVILDPGENPKFRPGSGLSAKRFLKIVRKHHGLDAFVSFVGAPQLSDEDVAQLKSSPKLIAETHSPEKLMNLLQKKILVCAIVPRFEFPAPGPRQPHTDRQWFDHYFQVVAADTPLPNADDSP